MRIDDDEINFLTHEISIALGKSGHVMTISLSMHTGLYGATVKDHTFPSGAICKRCQSHLISVNTDHTEAVIAAIRLHEKNCPKLRRRRFQLVDK